MRKIEEEPHSGSTLWLMAILVIVLSTKVDSIAADIVMLAIAGYTMQAHSNGSQPPRPSKAGTAPLGPQAR